MNKIKNCLMLMITLLVCSTMSRAGETTVFTSKSKLTLSGRVHAQFHTTNVEYYAPASTFFIRRARIKADFEDPGGRITGRVQFDFGEGKAVLKDGFINWKLSDVFKVKMGQFKKPFSLWELTSTTKLMVIERANKIMGSNSKYSTNAVILKDGNYAARDIGVQFHGSGGKVDYAVGIFNGNGSNNKYDDESGKTFVGRIAVNARDDLSIGASFANRMITDFITVSGNDTTQTDENFQAVELDIDYGIGAYAEETGPWVQAELLWGKNPHFTNTDTEFLGITAAGSYNIPMEGVDALLSIRPAFRIDWSIRNRDDKDTQTILLTPGVDFFFDKNNRLQINLDVNVPNDDGYDTEYGFRTQFQMLI